jgi:excisionase family DNA binding protein
MMERALTTYEIAAYCHVTPRTVIQWVNDSKLKAYRTPGKHSRIKMEDFLGFLRKYNIPMPLELMNGGGGVSYKRRILIVDDEQGMVDAIKRFLKRENHYDLEVAYDGFEAGEKFSDFKPDLIVLDIKMPKLDGHQLCERLRSNPKNKDIKILVISGTIDQEEVVRIKASGANDYLEKPFRNKDLKEKIERLLS